MLQYLHIQNFKLIDELEIEFGKGLNIIAGETGAGKSVILDAIGFVLGGRGERNVVRKGEDKSIVNCILQINSQEKINALKEYDIEPEDKCIHIRRQISQNGVQVIKINNEVVSKTLLQNIMQDLVSLHTQNENLELFHHEKQMQIIDSLGSEKLWNLREKIKENYTILLQSTTSINKLSEKINYYEKNKELVFYQLEELKEFFNREIDEDALYEELRELHESSEQVKTLAKVQNYLSNQGEEHFSLQGIIGAIVREISKVKSKTSFVEGIRSEFIDIQERLIDLMRGINAYMDSTDFDEERFIEIQSFLSETAEIKRKYKQNSMKELENYYQKLVSAKEQYSKQVEEKRQLESTVQKLEKDLISFSELLGEERKKIAKYIEAEITRIIKELNMVNAQVKIQFEKKAISATGMDAVSFFVKTTKNSDFCLMENILSGGELSRIYFAIKAVIASVDSVETNIFDEIDTGISGRTSQIVGEYLYKMSVQNQVICITHSPQIAAFADYYLYINKEEFSEYETTRVRILSEEEKTEELARLIAGKKITELTRQSSREMIEFATCFKNQYRGNPIETNKHINCR